jgi:3-oxoacyl-[acyl-carrier protein] reductase
MKHKGTIIITGAGRGLGLACTKHLLQQGFRVIAVSRHTTLLQELVDPNLSIEQADINKEADRKEIITHHWLQEENNLIGLLNNAAAIWNKPAEQIEEAEMLSIYKTNVVVPVLLSKDLVHIYKGKVQLHVVNIGSMGGVQGSVKFPGLSVYASSKAALAGMTECLAEEWKGDLVAVNCLALGAVRTEMLKSAFPDYQGGISSELMAEQVSDFVVSGYKYFNGKILPVSNSTP